MIYSDVWAYCWIYSYISIPNIFLYEEFMAIGIDIINGVQWSDHQNHSTLLLTPFSFLFSFAFCMNVANFAKCKFCSSYQYGKSTNGITFHFLKQRRQKGKIYIIFSIFLENITKICKQRILFRFLRGKNGKTWFHR